MYAPSCEPVIGAIAPPNGRHLGGNQGAKTRRSLTPAKSQPAVAPLVERRVDRATGASSGSVALVGFRSRLPGFLEKGFHVVAVKTDYSSKRVTA